MDQWQQPYSDSAGPRRYNGNPPPNQQPPPQVAREFNGHVPSQPPAGFTYEQYQGGIGAHPHPASSPNATPHMRDGNGDVAMQDAGDQYSGMKYPMRPHHQQHLSSSARVASHHSSQEPSAAAQRYSPMETLSPSSPYGASQQGQGQYGSRQSPTRPGAFSSPNSYYSSRQQTQQQLPPITPYASNTEGYPSSATAQLNAMFGNDPKSPRRPVGLNQGPPGRGPVPEFTKIRSVSDLQPKVNSQPAFRRANPEGGFISVSQTHQPERARLTAT
jgi:dual specificity protein kinase YAK1